MNNSVNFFHILAAIQVEMFKSVLYFV